MAALETIRKKFGIGASIIIALGLLLFLVNPSDIIQTIQGASSKYDVGKINGKRIPYTEFEQEVRRFTEIREMMTGTTASSEQAQLQVRESAWQNLVDQYLFIPTARAAGVNVGNQEVVDIFLGNTYSPFLASTGLFMDENGNYSQEQVLRFLEEVEADASGRGALLRDYLHNTVRSAQYSSKYAAMFSASSFQNNLQINRAVAENNTTATVDFVMVPLSYYPMDSSIVVSNSEIKNYYNNHKNFFKQVATRDIEYAVFEVVPSDVDIARENEAFLAQYDDFATATNMRAFLQRNSDRQWTGTWYKAGELASINRELDAFVSANNSGVSPVYRSGYTFYAGRIMDQANIPDSVYVRHIMVALGNDGRALADSLLSVVNSRNFTALAEQFSLDRNNADEGALGNLGWMTQNAMIPGFEEVLTARPGKPFMVSTQFGNHIVEVVRTTAPVAKKQVAIFEKEATASQETYNNFYNQANVLATRSAGKYANFRAACDSTGLYAHPMTITEATANYGAIDHAKEVTRWAFDNKPGKASNIITVGNNYFFVVAVKDAHKEGFTPLDEMSERISMFLYREKYAAAQQAVVADRIAGLNTMQEIAEALDVPVSTVTDVTFSTMSAPTTEPAFVGAVASAQEGVISGPVAGMMGVYVFQVTGRDTGSYYTEDDARSARANIEASNAQILTQVMMEGKVDDNRARFY